MRQPARPPRQPARAYALWLLARREWSAAELERRLVQRGYDRAEASHAVAELARLGLQSDERYAQGMARRQGARAGNRKVAGKLRAAGIGNELVQAQLQELPDEEERALKALSRFSGQPLDMATRARAWRFLASRGFSSTTIMRAWRAFCEQCEEPHGNASD